MSGPAELTAVNLIHWATAAVRLAHAIRRLQEDPADAALLKDEQCLADEVLDYALPSRDGGLGELMSTEDRARGAAARARTAPDWERSPDWPTAKNPKDTGDIGNLQPVLDCYSPASLLHAPSVPIREKPDE